MQRWTVPDLLSNLPGPQGQRFVELLTRGDVRLELYAPRDRDLQTPHVQDELYFVASGHGTFVCQGVRTEFGPGDAFLVPAGAEHRFEGFSIDFATWVLFFGGCLAHL